MDLDKNGHWYAAGVFVVLCGLSMVIFGINFVGCGSTDCVTDNRDLLCIYEGGTNMPIFPNSDFVRKYYKNGKLDTIFRNAPAVRTCKTFGSFGRLCKYEYYRDGLRHCEWGPAVVDFLGSKEWWLEGEKYNTKEEWEYCLVKEDEYYSEETIIFKQED